jgi:hypothetical protein
MNNQRFTNEFGSVLGETSRWDFFKHVNEYLGNLCRPIYVVETGTARQTDNWDGDGQSTRVWDWMAKEYGGHVVSIDIDENAVNRAREYVSLKTQFIVSDSVVALHEIPNKPSIDMLYLDSMDAYYEGSAEHHYQELKAVYDQLRVGALIAIDDYRGKGEGKTAVIEALFDRKWIPGTLFQNKVLVYAKPATHPTIASLEDAG